jgi:hypothetical protein
VKIYLASSWRNKDRVNEVDAYLTGLGHECFNFTNPGPKVALPNGFHWSEINPDWQSWTPEGYRSALDHRLAKHGLAQDFGAMQWADACVAIQPFGRSASLELGWFVGQKKPAIVILESGEPELMLGLADLCLTMEEAADLLRNTEWNIT